MRQLINGDSNADVTKGKITLTTSHSGESVAKIRTIRAQVTDEGSKYKCCFILTGTKDLTKLWLRIMHYSTCECSPNFSVYCIA